MLFQARVSALFLGILLPCAASSAPLFSIGNSLTWDALRRYAGEFDHVINCNQSLQQIFERPEQTCLKQVPGARPWDTAFEEVSYDYVTVQPFTGTSLAQDVAAIGHWMKLQPEATFIIHTGWTTVENRARQFEAPLDPKVLSYGPAYFDALADALEGAFPGRRPLSTNIIGILDEIADDVEAGDAPFESVGDLYRDIIHFNTTGQYIATQSFNRLLRTPLDPSRFESVDAETRKYLDRKIANNVVPEPGAGLLLGLSSARTASSPDCRLIFGIQ